jgi:hypothetical protein
MPRQNRVTLHELEGRRRMFARGVLDAVQAEREEEFLRAVEEAARPMLFLDGTWQADYRRLRVVAFREG